MARPERTVGAGLRGGQLQFSNPDRGAVTGPVKNGLIPFLEYSAGDGREANAPVIDGTDGPDTLVGTDGDDTINGLGGNDDIRSGDGNDTINGGNGDDTLIGGGGDDSILGGDGDDTIFGDLFGVPGNDILDGGRGNDYIDGDSGDDILIGGEGNDELYGGDGADELHGGDGFDQVYGGAGNDVLYGDGSGDTLGGGDGDDTLFGGEGSDHLNGDSGSDILYGENGDDSLDGGAGDDRIFGGDGSDTIFAGADDDYIEGGAGNDNIYGESGNDTIISTSGSDFIRAGDGDDTILVAHTTSVATHLNIDASTGNDYINIDRLDTTGDGSYSLDLQLWVGDDTIRIGALTSGYFTLGLGTGSDRIILDPAIIPQLHLGPVIVQDFQTGFGGDEIDLARFGASYFTDDSGEFRLVIDGNNSILQARADSGSAFVNLLILQGVQTTDINALNANVGPIIQGTDGDDVIDGTTGDDQIYGGAGDDVINALAGNDLVDGEAGNDRIFGAEGDDELHGGDGDDELYGGADGDDTFFGGAGADYIDGGLGNDTADGGEGDDTIIGGSGADTLRGGDGDDTIDGGFHNDILIGGRGNDTITGDEGNDTLDGGAGNDTLDGGEGDDQIVGGDGNDTILVSAGSDTVDAGDGNDIITVSHTASTQAAITINAGAGDDVIDIDQLTVTGNGGHSLTIDDGEGNDRLIINAMPSGGLTLSLNEGIDTVVLTAALANSIDDFPIVFERFQGNFPGYDLGDVLDLNGLVDAYFAGGSGEVRIAPVGEDTVISIRREGDTDWTDLIVFERKPIDQLDASNFVLDQPMLGAPWGYDSVIIPDIGSAPDVTPTTEEIFLPEGGYTIGAGEVFLVNDLPTLLRVQEGRVPIVNEGTVWIDSDQPNVFFVVGFYPDITNHGLIYVRGPNQVQINFGANNYVNTGTMVAVSEFGVAHAIRSDIQSNVENSGLIAAQARFSSAYTINSFNGSYVINHEGGQILAEAYDTAVAIFSRGSDRNVGDPIVTNHGLIEAHSTGPDGISFGVYVSQVGHAPATIVNSGTIRADVAIYATYNTTTRIEAVDHVFNLSGGVIEGLIFLDTGDDIIENDGTIIGDILMGENSDTYSGDGRVQGVVDMGFGNDSFEGGNFTDIAVGNRGNDVLSGRGGNDLLLGGFGNDHLTGGAGNDGLFGEFGDDTIITRGGDYVDGGFGEDRIELGDYTFELVNGGSGFDVLAMAAGARNFSLSAMVANGRIARIDAIELRGSQNLAVDASSIGKLSDDASTLWVDATGTDAVHLQGSWTRGSDISFDGTAYQVWTQGSFTVLVTAVASVVNNSAPSYGGFDAIAGGATALRPGEEAGVGYTPRETYLFGYIAEGEERVFSDEVQREIGRFVVEADEVFFTDNSSPIFLNGTTLDQFVNNGELYALNDTGARATALSVVSLINTNLIVAESLGTDDDNPFTGYTIAANLGFGGLQNSGGILAYSAFGNASGVHTPGTFNNSSLISAIADNGFASGVWRATGTDGINASRFINTGVIYAEGSNIEDPSFYDPNFSSILDGAVAVGVYGVGNFVNDGVIEAVVGANAAPGAYSFGLYTYPSSSAGATGTTVVNNGTLIGTTAVYFHGEGANQLTNTGLLVGDIAFSLGNDLYDNSTGETRGTVFGNAGRDTFITGAFDDDLDGGSGRDTAVFAGNFDQYDVREGAVGRFTITGAGTDSVVRIEVLRFDDIEVLLDLGSGLVIDPGTANPDSFMVNIRDYDGNDLGGGSEWVRIGEADANLDGSMDYIFVNREIGRFAEVGVDANGRVLFDNHGQGGDTRVVGIYIDPLVESGEVEAGGDFDSQRRFQNDLFIGNISTVLGSDDYDGDGFAEIFFALTDGTAYLRAIMHADGNIQYANYQSEQQVIEYLTANGYDESTFGSWFSNATGAADTVTYVNESPKFADVEVLDRPEAIHARPLDEWQAEYFG